MITQEFKVYITNPQYFNSTQNDFEKNLHGSIFIDENPSPSGITEKTAIGKIYGIPVPFTNPQTNVVVENNDGSIIQNGEPSMFLPPKTLATEMMATIRDVFFVKYGVNIDLSLDPPEAVADTSGTGATDAMAVSAEGTSGTAGATASVGPNRLSTPSASAGSTADAGVVGPSTSPKPTIDSDAGKKVLIGAGILGAGVLAGVGINALINKNKDKKDNSTSGVTSSVSTTPTVPVSTVEVPQEKKLDGMPILVPSQYLDVYVISNYGGEKALVTTKESKQMVWLDKEYDRPEFLPGNLTSPLKENVDGTGDFGINIHLGYPGGKKVGYWSEKGDQVFSTQEELKEFFTYVEKHITIYGNKITYTLCTRTDWDEAQKAVQTNQQAPPDAGMTPSVTPVEEKPGPSQSTPVEEVKEILNTVFENLNFDTNKDTIKKESYEGLDKLAELMKKETSWKLLIEGHTDSDGSEAYNLDLSKRRAASAKKYLVDKGVAAGMITSEGYGESKPIADNKTPEGKAKNRRVVFTITKPDKEKIVAGQTV
jgi:outer membrane protein OmpA-like peptidoglycan-associated protein